MTQDIERYREHLARALAEVAAGNERMRPYAEAYAVHLDRLVAALNKNEAAAKPECIEGDCWKCPAHKLYAHPTMTREELIAAAENIGMRFPVRWP